MLTGISGNQEVGQGNGSTDNNPHALLWTGTAASVVDLTSGPNAPHMGHANATDGAQQVGVAGGGAALWSGTAGSYVNLNPIAYASSEAFGVWNGIQVGYGGEIPNTDALLWHGSASSYVVLKVGGIARGISRGQVVGYAGEGGTNVAASWANATPQSFANLAPGNTTASELFATNGVQQVGDVSLTIGAFGQLPVDHHAGLWHGTPTSFQMLPIPQGLNYSIATGIDGDGNISGLVGVQSAGGVGGFSPVLWTQPHLPGDANFDGTVGFDDLVVLAKNYGKPGDWVDGDFNGDGVVNFADLVILAQDYGKGQQFAQTYSMTEQGPVQVLEPPVGPTIAFAAILLRRSRGLPAGA